jgi:hypothetical protein
MLVISAESCREGRTKVKPIKTFGLAALAALLAMAFVGATSAVATDPTALCEVDPGTGLHEVCPAGKLVTHVHETTLAEKKGILKTSLLTIECDVLFLGDVTTTGALAKAKESLLIVGLHDPAKGEIPLIGAFVYSNCSNSCTATEENGPPEIKVLKEGHETAKVTGEGLVHVVCGKSIDCSYNGTGLVGTAKGPLLSTETNGDVTLTEVKTTKEVGGFLCPKESKLTITTTPLTATYITE